ncbi:hypothetical protein KL940_004873, partial [Ogataea angusta]
MMKTVIPHGNK